VTSTSAQRCQSLKPGTHWRQSRKDIRHSGDKNYPLSTKSTELNMFNFGDSVDRDTVDKIERAGDDRLSINRRQIGDRVDSRLCRRFVAGLGDCRLFRQCVLGFRVLKIFTRRWRSDCRADGRRDGRHLTGLLSHLRERWLVICTNEKVAACWQINVETSIMYLRKNSVYSSSKWA